VDREVSTTEENHGTLNQHRVTLTIASTSNPQPLQKKEELKEKKRVVEVKKMRKEKLDYGDEC